MTLQQDCIPCQHGDHENHQPVPNPGIPGLIGSRWECGCQGDCTGNKPKQLEMIERAIPMNMLELE